jgi:hypothetical protein
MLAFGNIHVVERGKQQFALVRRLSTSVMRCPVAGVGAAGG